MIIKSDNKQVTEKFKKLEELMVKNGAWFHEKLTIVIKGDDMQLEMLGPVDQQVPILKVPQNLLIPFEAATITVKDNLLVCNPDKDIFSPVQVQIANLVIAIFNATNKLSVYQKECFYIKYKESRELLELLLNAKSETPQKKKKTDFFRGELGPLSEEEFLCWGLFQSRLLGKKNNAGKTILYFMPIIDCLNHDYRGSHFSFEDDCLVVKNMQTFPGTGQCYASYGHYDTLDLFLTYGYIDINIPYTISVPINLKVADDYTLKIKNFGVRKTDQNVPEQLKDLQEILPNLQKEDDKTFVIPHLFIPSAIMPHSLRRILHAITKTIMGGGASSQSVMEEVRRLEKEVIQANIDFYQNVVDQTKSIETPENLKTEIHMVANAQLNKLYKYPYQGDFYRAQATPLSGFS